MIKGGAEGETNADCSRSGAGGEVQGVREMPPVKKSKKGKRKSKDGKLKIVRARGAPPALPPELRALDTEWWYAFLNKQVELEHAVPPDEGEAFRHFFRTSRKTFDYICSIVREDLISRPPSGLINIEGRLLSVEKQVAIAMRRLASGDSQVSVGTAFGVGQSTVSQVTWRFIESMEDRARYHLAWPSQERLEQIKAVLEDAYGLPNCCGGVDATHVIMTLPAVESSADWCDHAKNYSMFLQGIVDDQMRFIDIVTGWPGSMTFSRLMKCSGFFKLCEAGERLNGSVKVSAEGAEIREYIAGDSCYPLLPWLMTPFEGKHLPAPLQNFNARQKAARLLGTNALARLKGSWRILHKVMWRPDKNKLPSIILVCCLLHNILIDCHDELLPSVQLPEHHDTGYNRENCEQVDPNGKVMRENITAHLQHCEASKFLCN